HAAHQEGGEEFIDPPGPAHGGDEVLPDEDHGAAGDHAGDGPVLVGPLPEQGEEDQGPEGGAEACPGEGDDVEHRAVGVPGQEDGYDGDDDDGGPGGPHGGLGAELQAEEIL